MDKVMKISRNLDINTVLAAMIMSNQAFSEKEKKEILKKVKFF